MKILIATDGSDYSEAAIEEACAFLKPHATKVLCLSAYENPLPVAIEPGFYNGEYYQAMADNLRQAAEGNVKEAERQIRMHFSDAEVPVTTEVAEGYADKCIIEKAVNWKADLIVVGSHGRGFWGRMLGSVSDGVVHHAPCSVLVVRSRD